MSDIGLTSGAALPQTARVVIIGGGVVGCSALYHLAKLGWRDCVLLERRELSCGSSWHAAGAFHIINSNANLSALQLHTLKFYPQLQAESEQDIGYHRTGGIYFASAPERLNYLKQERAKNRKLNPDMEFISLTDAKRLHPLIDESQFIGALYDPLDGYIDPASVVQAYAKAARKYGAAVFQNTMVTATTPNPDGSWRIAAERAGIRATIRADVVVNAGGLWAREVGAMAGLRLPLMPMEHHYMITEPLQPIIDLPGELPNFVDFDGNSYGRQEGQGLLIGTYEENGQAWSPRQTPWDFGHELLPNATERVAARMETAFAHFPPLANAGIKKVVNGPFTFAPDGNALVGPIPGLRNYWSACAVMAGFAQGAGIGEVLAQWMDAGEPGMDVFAMDVARFGDFATPDYTHKRVVENFGRRFQISYPNEELPAARPWRTTALYETLRRRGAVMGAAFGLEHALWFADSPDAAETPTFRRSNAFDFVGAEARMVAGGVGLIEVANFAKYEVSGAGATAYLDRIMAGRLPAAGRVRLCPMLSRGGRLIGDLSVTRLDEGDGDGGDGGGARYFIVGSGGAQMAHVRHFLAHLPADGSVVFRNRSSELHGIAIAGPQSRELLAQVCDADVSGESLPFMGARECAVGGAPAALMRVSFTGELGYEIYCAPEYQLAVYRALTSVGGVECGVFGGRALMSMRLEKNYGAWILDYREDFTPAEAGLDVFVAADKPADFIGKSAFCAAPARRRVMLAISGSDADASGDEPVLTADDAPVGMITSGGYGHRVGVSLAVAYIDVAALDSADLFVEILGKKYAANIQHQPLYDPTGAKMRA